MAAQPHLSAMLHSDKLLESMEQRLDRLKTALALFTTLELQDELTRRHLDTQRILRLKPRPGSYLD